MEQEEQIEHQPKHFMTAKSFAAKYNSKRDIFYFLTIEVCAYLCDHENLTIYFLKKLISGERKYVRCCDVNHIFIPQYETLTLGHIFDFLNKFTEVFDYLPDSKELTKCPKQWLGNIAATVVGQPFKDWVYERIKDRNKKMSVEKNLLLTIDDDVFKAFNRSTNVTTHRGTGANLLKVGIKRRRTKAQIAQEKEEQILKEHDIKKKLEQREVLQDNLNGIGDLIKSQQDPATIIQQLVDMGLFEETEIQVPQENQQEEELDYDDNDD